jgi:hypothetical protein
MPRSSQSSKRLKPIRVLFRFVASVDVTAADWRKGDKCGGEADRSAQGYRVGDVIGWAVPAFLPQSFEPRTLILIESLVWSLGQIYTGGLTGS